MVQCKNSQVNIVSVVNANAKAGNERDGGFGLGERNGRGDKLVEWARVYNMISGNLLSATSWALKDIEESRK